jgi:hypothetical protein
MMPDITPITKLRESADRCRRLAAAASDPNVAKILREIADEMEAAIPILEENAFRNSTVNTPPN